MLSKLIIYLAAAIFIISLICGSTHAEVKDSGKTLKLIFHAPPTLQNETASEYKTWLDIGSTSFGDSIKNEHVITAMKHHPQLRPFFNVISKYVEPHSSGDDVSGPLFTIFAPIAHDAAYWRSLSNVEQEINYHIHPGKFYDLGNLNTQYRYLVGENGPIVRRLESGHIQVDCTLIISKPIIARNGIIYPIYKPLNIQLGTVLRASLESGGASVC
jgi:hypothetical protein